MTLFLTFLRRTRRTLLRCTLLLTALSALAACSPSKTAPDSSFLLLNGQRATLADYQGKVLLVNFWATTCASCVQEMPELVRTHQQFKDRGFEMVAVAMSYDPPNWVANFAHSRRLPFAVALDHDGALAKSWGDVSLTPTTFVVDKHGRIVKQYLGAPDFAALHRLIDELLQAS